MNLKWNLLFVSLVIEHFILINCASKKKHYQSHSIVSEYSIPKSLTTNSIAEQNYNPEESMCIWKDDLDNIYNLSLLQKSDSYWQVDVRTTEQQNFKISLVFNFCNNFPNIACSEKQAITKLSSQHFGAFQQITFQNVQSLDQCSAFGQYDKSLVELIDYYQVGQGIKIVYRGGDICTSSENPMDQDKQKSITFLIYCSSEKDKEENFTSLPIDGISVTSCNPVLQIKHPGGCYQGQILKQKHKINHPILLFLLTLIIFIFILTIVIITIFNCIENNVKGFMAIPFYQDLKMFIERFPNQKNCRMSNSFATSFDNQNLSQDSNLFAYKPV
ncbi:hypothetical protein ABPG74_008530 [Tetrahymena malaccensis]